MMTSYSDATTASANYSRLTTTYPRCETSSGYDPDQSGRACDAPSSVQEPLRDRRSIDSVTPVVLRRRAVAWADVIARRRVRVAGPYAGLAPSISTQIGRE